MAAEIQHIQNTLSSDFSSAAMSSQQLLAACQCEADIALVVAFIRGACTANDHLRAALVATSIVQQLMSSLERTSCASTHRAIATTLSSLADHTDTMSTSTARLLLTVDPDDANLPIHQRLIDIMLGRRVECCTNDVAHTLLLLGNLVEARPASSAGSGHSTPPPKLSCASAAAVATIMYRYSDSVDVVRNGVRALLSSQQWLRSAGSGAVLQHLVTIVERHAHDYTNRQRLLIGIHHTDSKQLRLCTASSCVRAPAYSVQLR
jgi:hypothetical protein